MLWVFLWVNDMGAKFKRVYRVVVGKPGSKGIEITPPLHCEFDLSKNTSEDPNEYKVRLFNLKPETRDAISAPDQIVVLYAGYAEDEGEILIASGAIADAYTYHDSGNVVTEILLGDGLVEVRDTVISVGYGGGVKAHEIIKAIALKMGLVLMMQEDLPNKDFPHGFSFYGAAKTALHKVVRGSGMEWSIQNQTLQVIASKGVTKRTALVIAPDTGLIGYPERTTEGAKEKARVKDKSTGKKKEIVSSRQERSGWRVMSLLIPQINPGDVVKLESKTVNDFFRVDAVTHTGGYDGGDWQTELQLVGLNAPTKEDLKNRGTKKKNEAKK